MKLSLGGGVLAVVAALLLAPGATAKPREFTLPGSQIAEFKAKASNGFNLFVQASDEGFVYADFAKGATSVSYTTKANPADLAAGRIDATLPGIGRIAVDFQARGKPERYGPYKGCKGRGGRTDRGFFVGTVKLRGERNFTAIERTRLRGAVKQTYRQTCKRTKTEPPKKGGGKENWFDQTTLTVNGERAGGSLFFGAFRWEVDELSTPLEEVTYVAGLSVQKQGLRVLRVVAVDGGPRTFTATAPDAPSTATVAAPQPFSGTGSFALAADGSPLWTGDLSVELPGIEPLLLTGKQLKAELCINWKCGGDDLGGNGRGRESSIVVATARRGA